MHPRPNNIDDDSNLDEYDEVCICPGRVYKNSYLHGLTILLCVGLPIGNMLLGLILSYILDEQKNPNRTNIMFASNATLTGSLIIGMGAVLFFGTKRDPRLDEDENAPLPSHRYI